MAKDAAVIGIDLGGTNVRLALVSPGGEILARWERATATMPHQMPWFPPWPRTWG